MALSSRITSAIRTDVGRVRTNNEDVVVADDDLGLIVLADGMGGYNAGEVASRLAVTTVHARIRQAHDEPNSGLGTERASQTTPMHSPAAQLLRGAIIAAHEAILKTAAADRQYAGMGTTIVCCLIHNKHMSIAHVGDSRLYRLRNRELHQLTRDHSLLEELIARGAYAREEANRYVRRNIVTRALGVETGVEVELGEETVEIGDILLLCSDGLTDMVDDATIADIMIKHNVQISDTAEELVRTANERGGKDNISVALTRVDRPEADDSSWSRKLARWLQVGS
jgi:serine/threonine protein phosphatase PrpC